MDNRRTDGRHRQIEQFALSRTRTDTICIAEPDFGFFPILWHFLIYFAYSLMDEREFCGLKNVTKWENIQNPAQLYKLYYV